MEDGDKQDETGPGVEKQIKPWSIPLSREVGNDKISAVCFSNNGVYGAVVFDDNEVYIYKIL